jgi:hypothetical protein
MSQGQLWLFNKIKQSGFYRRNVALDIVNTFNMEENLNGTPSNMKVKVVTSNTYREEFEVNTIAYHPDTTTWWVIKSDTSAYLHTGEYEHEIELVELLEFYSYRHLPNCAFAPNTYTLDQMITRVFSIGKQTDIAVVSPHPSFLDFGKQMPFLSFENFTIANAIKTIARSINAIPKVFGTLVTGEVTYIQNFKLTFINRNGNETAIDSEDLNTKFPIAYEHNANSSDQFLTRSVSNISNAKSSNIVIAPQQGGFKMFTPNSGEYSPENSIVFLPSKIDKVEFVRVFPKILLNIVSEIDGETNTKFLYEGYYNDVDFIKQIIIQNASSFDLYTLQELQNLNLPTVEQISQISYKDTLSTNFELSIFKGLFTIQNQFDFNTAKIQSSPFDTVEKVQDKTIHWRPFTNELIMSKNFRNGLLINSTPDQFRSNFNLVQKTVAGVPNDTERIRLTVITRSTGFLSTRVPNEEMLIQVGYFPISDIKVSYDNDNDAQDEKFFNQSGKVIDAFSTSQLIISHTNDSVEGTKIRNARYDDYANIVPLGQIVRDNNELYIVSQRSIDMMFRDNGNNYFNVIYTLSKNRVARSENIQADSAVINYKTPDENLVSRSQLYKDYIELSLENGNKDPNPYLSLSKMLLLTNTLAGVNFDFTVLAKNTYDSTIIRYIQNPTTFDLAKSKLVSVNWQSNNLLGFRFDYTGDSFVQTPIVYTNELGKATAFELMFMDKNEINLTRNEFNDTYSSKKNSIIPFNDLTNVDNDFRQLALENEPSLYSIGINESNYDKDPFEIPVFEYMIQGNDDYNALGNVILSNELFSSYSKSLIRYNYVISNTRFTAENADRLFFLSSPAPSFTSQRVLITRPVGTTNINLKLYNEIISAPSPSGLNTIPLQGKHIGIFAVGDDFTRKFLFAINDYAITGTNSNNDITLYINNWKI